MDSLTGQGRLHSISVLLARLSGLCALCLWLAAAIVQAKDMADTKVYPIPRLEAEQVVMVWLEQQGCTVVKTTHDSVSELRAIRGARQWRIGLKHHSPLASEVWLANAVPDEGDARMWKQLTSYLEDYAALQGVTIPAAVLAHEKLVVCIRALAQGQSVQLSGFVVDRDGLILCTAHTLNKPQSIGIFLNDGTRLTGRLIRMDERKDLALIECNYRFGEVVGISNDKSVPGLGEQVYALGCPNNRRVTVVSGLVDGPPQLVQDQPLIQVRMEVDPGSSGSPVFNEKGNLTAIVKGRLKKDNRTGLLIPLETIIAFIKDI